LSCRGCCLEKHLQNSKRPRRSLSIHVMCGHLFTSM
jgi:hypothetical protein